jgi:hypothetical protein
VLGLEVLGPVLADDLDAGLGEHGHVLERRVFGGGDDGHAGRARLVVALANGVRR